MIEDGQTYFGYSLNQDYIDGDFDRNYSMQVTLNGHLVRKNNSMVYPFVENIKILDSLHNKETIYSYMTNLNLKSKNGIQSLSEGT